MLPKLKSATFIDTLVFELSGTSTLHIVLSDEYGSVCHTLQVGVSTDQKIFHLSGLNHLPYGCYTLEMLAENRTEKISIVKKV